MICCDNLKKTTRYKSTKLIDYQRLSTALVKVFNYFYYFTPQSTLDI